MGKRKTKRKVGGVESSTQSAREDNPVSAETNAKSKGKYETQTQGVRRSPRKNQITVTGSVLTSKPTHSTTRRTRQAKNVVNESPTVRSTTTFERTTTGRGRQGKKGASDDPAPFSTPSAQHTSKSQSRKRQAEKRSINDLKETNAPNNKWSEESTGKKRKLSGATVNEGIAQTNGKLYEHKDISRVEEEKSSLITKEEFEKMKIKYEDDLLSKDNELDSLRKELSENVNTGEQIKLEHEKKERSMKEEISRLKEALSERIPKKELESMKLKYDEEKLSQEEEILRLQQEVSSRIPRTEFDKMKCDYEEKTRSKNKELTRLTKEATSYIAKGEFEKMKMKYEDDIRSKNEELASLRKELSERITKEELEKIKLKYKEKKRSRKEEISRLKQEVSSRIAEEEYDKMKQRYEEEKRSKEEELRRLQQEFRLKQVIATRISKEEFDKMKFDYEEERRSKDEELTRLRQDISSRVSKEEYDRIRHEYEAEKRLKDEALTRLSAMASSQLRYNNPNIADLSDENRPTKIAEKMSELYDNQWTDAYDALQNEMDEKDIINFLLDILMKTYQECKKIAGDSYFEKVQRLIELPLQEKSSPKEESVLPDQLKHLIKEFRKSRAVHVIKDVEEAITCKLQLPYSHLDYVKKYISCCVEISWLMVVQDPPVVITTETSSKFDTNIYKEYTKRGPFVEYVVWPALLLHEGGPILAKGVAQGCKK